MDQQLKSLLQQNIARVREARRPVTTEVPTVEEQSYQIEPISSGEITRADLQQLVQRRGQELDDETEQLLSRSISFLGGAPAKELTQDASVLDTVARYRDVAQGFLGESVGMGLPQKLYTKAAAANEQQEQLLSDLRELAQERKSGARTAAELITGVAVPALATGGASLLGRAAVGAAYGAASGLGSSKAGDELAGTTTGAALGGVLGAAIPKLAAYTVATLRGGRDLVQAAGRLVNKTRETIDLDGAIAERMAKQLDKNAREQQLLAQLATNQLAGGTKGLDGKLQSLVNSFSKFANATPEEVLQRGELRQEVQRWQELRAARKIIIERGLEGRIPEISGLQRLALKFSDNRPVAEILDNRLGVGLGKALDDASRQNNKMTTEMAVQSEVLDDFFRSLPDGVTAIQIRDKSVAPEVLEAWNKLTNNLANRAKQLGIPLVKQPDYVPELVKRTEEYIPAFRQAIRQIESDLGEELQKLKLNDLKKLANTNKDLRGVLHELSRIQPVTDDATLRSAINLVKHDVGAVSDVLSQPTTFALHKRTGEQMPDWARDNDLRSLAQRWMHSVFREAYMKQPMKQLKLQADKLRALGQGQWAEHFEDAIKDVWGTQRDTIANTLKRQSTRTQVALREAANKLPKGAAREAVLTAAEYPTLLNTAVRQIYGNVLGLNAKAALQNLTSPLLTAVPELGYSYGLGTYARANAALLSQIKTKGWKSVNQELLDEGVLPKHFAGELAESLSSTGKRIGTLARGGERINNVLLMPFSAAEKVARAQVMYMSRAIAQDLIGDTVFAKKFLGALPDKSYVRPLQAAIQRKDAQQTNKLMQQYLNARYLFNYDKHNMSATGRALGPLFSQFQKWPTTMTGKLMADFERQAPGQAALKTARVLLAPYAGLALMDELLRDPESQATKKLVGARGLAEWAPVSAVPGLGHAAYAVQSALRNQLGDDSAKLPAYDKYGKQSGILESPVLGAAYEVASAVNDPKQLQKATENLLSLVLPGMGSLRFAGEDFPQLFLDEAPDYKQPALTRRLSKVTGND